MPEREIHVMSQREETAKRLPYPKEKKLSYAEGKENAMSEREENGMSKKEGTAMPEGNRTPAPSRLGLPRIGPGCSNLSAIQEVYHCSGETV